ncbi:MAG: family 10 glycosylhydrolase [Opitutae bacterium]|nr:family 10 glycosylhydrolase [Opitutae bacterium]
MSILSRIFGWGAFATLILLLAGCVTRPTPVEPPPPAPREFRGVWVATVANIDWPSKPGLPVEQQRAELIAILDRAHALRLNAVILQVRPAADALYLSALEPWTEYLSGTQGRAPEPLYDPLQVWITEAHRRGLELHAWFNPYRARHHQAKSDFAPTHLAKTHPAVVKRYGELWWMDPGDAFAAQRTLDVVADVVRRYDVDGVHIDDYFYPYPIPQPLSPKAPKDAPREDVPFPDEPSWQRYLASGGQLARTDWRRQNVDQLVEQLYRTIHAIKPWVKFGVSPFGLGRPDRRPAGIEGFSQYDKLYADVELWLQKGWLDYLAPQLYWPRSQKAQAFEPLLDYWAKQNTAQRHLWPGLFTSAINDTPQSWTPEEILQQIAVTRSRPAASGLIQFSMAALMQDRRGIAEKLAAGPYAQPALVPPTPWLDAQPPPAPKLKRRADGKITVMPGKGKAAANYAVWRRQDRAWNFSVQPATDPVVEAGTAEAIVVSAVDRLGNESPRVTLLLKTP